MNIKHNVELNPESTNCPVKVKLLDFEKVADGTQIIEEEDKTDVILASDVVYGLHLAGFSFQIDCRLGSQNFAKITSSRWCFLADVSSSRKSITATHQFFQLQVTSS